MLAFMNKDARHWQILFLFSFITYGIFALQWAADASRFALILGTAMATQYAWAARLSLPMHTMRSAIITGLGMCILLKTNSLFVMILAPFLAISSKFVIRYEGKHLFNPANFGIVAAILLTGEAWVSPGQWGSHWTTIIFVAAAGAMVLTNCGRIGTGGIFLATYLGGFFALNVLYRGWPLDFFMHQAFNGTIWLFGLFMITDPMTTPNHRITRIVWTVLVALISLYINQFYWISSAPIWVLFFTTPLAVALDQFAKGERYEWVTFKKSPAKIIQLR